MSIIEIIAVIFSLFSVILTARNKIWCWPVGIIGIIFYGILFYQNQIWGNMYLQLFFIVLSVVGWNNWRKPNKHPITWIYKKYRIPFFCIIGLIITTLYLFLVESMDKTPLLDSITTTLSIAGMFLMLYKKIDSWLCWILADIIFIWLFLANYLYLSAFIYFIFLINAIFGLINWNKLRKQCTKIR